MYSYFFIIDLSIVFGDEKEKMWSRFWDDVGDFMGEYLGLSKLIFGDVLGDIF